MKKRIKQVLTTIIYGLYHCGLLKNTIHVHTVDETLDELITSNKSLVRFGDGEILLASGKGITLQQPNSKLTEDLRRILSYKYDDLMVTLPEIFDDLSMYRQESQCFWKDHLLFFRKTYKEYCNDTRTYYNTSMSRFFVTYNREYQNKNCSRYAKKLTQIWQNKDVIIVEGVNTQNGLTNSMLNTAGSIGRIICPPKNAYESLDKIYSECCKQPKDRLFLISLGAAAKPLTEKLFLAGYRVIDIGNTNVEYTWYETKAADKVDIHLLTDDEEDKESQKRYEKYISEIICRI